MDTPVFIVGCARSGTTMLRLMLTKSPRLHVLHETNFIQPLWDRREEYRDFTQPHQRWFFVRDLTANQATSKTKSFPQLDLTYSEAEQALASVAPTDYPGACAAILAASARKAGKSRWGDKTPAQVAFVSLLGELFPNAKIIQIIRDGRACVLSMKNLGWSGANVKKLAEHYVKQVTTGREQAAKIGQSRYCEVRYEGLVAHPEETLRELCKWLDLEYVPQMLDFHRTADVEIPKEHHRVQATTMRPIDPSLANAWRGSLTEMEIADIELIAGNLLRELGYELVYGAFAY